MIKGASMMLIVIETKLETKQQVNQLRFCAVIGNYINLQVQKVVFQHTVFRRKSCEHQNNQAMATTDNVYPELLILSNHVVKSELFLSAQCLQLAS